VTTSARSTGRARFTESEHVRGQGVASARSFGTRAGAACGSRSPRHPEAAHAVPHDGLDPRTPRAPVARDDRPGDRRVRRPHAPARDAADRRRRRRRSAEGRRHRPGGRQQAQGDDRVGREEALARGAARPAAVVWAGRVLRRSAGADDAIVLRRMRARTTRSCCRLTRSWRGVCGAGAGATQRPRPWRARRRSASRSSPMRRRRRRRVRQPAGCRRGCLRSDR
jgi:hypothetical protein